MNPMIAGLTPSALARNSGRILTVTSLLKSVSIDTKPKTKTFWLSPKNLRCGFSCFTSATVFTSPKLSIQCSSHLIHVTVVTVYVTLHDVKRAERDNGRDD